MRSRGAESRQREARTARPAVGCERRVCGARRIKGGRVGIVALESTRRSSKTVCPCRRNKNLREGEQGVSLFCTCTSHARRTRSVFVASVCYFSVDGLSTCSRGTPSRSSRLDSRSRIFYIRAHPVVQDGEDVRLLEVLSRAHAGAAARATQARRRGVRRPLADDIRREDVRLLGALSAQGAQGVAHRHLDVLREVGVHWGLLGEEGLSRGRGGDVLLGCLLYTSDAADE